MEVQDNALAMKCQTLAVLLQLKMSAECFIHCGSKSRTLLIFMTTFANAD